jgi:hypothetical protein
MSRRGSRQAVEVGALLGRRDQLAGTRDLLERIVAALTPAETLERDTLDLLEVSLRGHQGEEHNKIAGEYADHIWFWHELSRRYPDNARLLGLVGDTLLLSGNVEEGTRILFTACERDPGLLSTFGGDLRAFARQAGGKDWLRYQLIELRQALGAADYRLTDEIVEEIKRDHGPRADVERLLTSILRPASGK